MALPPAFLDELRARTPLAELIGRRTRLIRAGGRNWKGCCPFHQEKTPSFYVYEDHFHCFGCGAHGDAVSFVMRAEGASFLEAVERLAAEAGLEVPKPGPEAAERERRARDLHAVLAAAAAAFERRLRLPEGRAALDYLHRRGLTEETIARFGLGWSGAGRGALAADLKAEGVEPEQLVEAGLVRPREGEGAAGGYSDFFFNRVMFPIRDRRGRVIGFGGRILGDGQPKYVNSPETALFRKRRALYGLDLAREAAFRGAAVVVVEGYMDVIALHQAGFGGAVAPLGTALTEEHLEELWRLTPEPVLCFDGDAAGARAAERAALAALPLLAPERTLRIATLPGGEDPDTLVARQGPRGFQALLDAARPLSEALFAMLAGARLPEAPEQRAALRNRLVAVAGTIPDRALAAEYRRAWLDRFFAAAGSARRAAPGGIGARRFRAAGAPSPRPPRPPLDPPAVRRERARILLAITLRHPWLLDEVEEPLAALDLPEGEATRLRAAILACHAAASRAEGAGALDSAGLMSQLASMGAADALAWALQGAGLPTAATADAQPREALDGWWHFFGYLRGEADLVDDRRAAERALVETNDPAAQRRLIRLTEALAALRRGDGTSGQDGFAGDP
ncbi:DNA primase [Caldovatus sediminis]|uniref:DNA primase n=1 Tax=Caldovatus sediminis TaxID=2041189 RepID=A0A8J3EAI6_9PROT|nr:DNA primase [Caldovatus sediminis]GGG16713.1 DNA primase [Caldovatus sediminis]